MEKSRGGAVGRMATSYDSLVDQRIERHSSMTRQSLDQHIVATPGTLGGKARIAGRRISVEDIAIWHVKLGKTVDEICAEFDLSLGEVHAALAYYYDHQAEIERDIKEGNAFARALRDSSPSKLAKRLAER